MRNEEALEVFMSTIAKAYAADAKVGKSDVIAVSHAFYDMAILAADKKRTLGNGLVLKHISEKILDQRFYSKKIPPIGFADFVFYMYERTKNTLCNVLAAFRLMCDYLKILVTDALSALDPLMVHRLFLVCFCVASKVNHDQYHGAPSYAQAAGLDVPEMLDLEVKLTSSLGYNFHALDAPSDMKKFLQALVESGPVTAAGVERIPTVFEMLYNSKKTPAIFTIADMAEVEENKEACVLENQHRF